MNILKFVEDSLQASAQNQARVAASTPLKESVAKAIELITESYLNGGTLYLAGNGGSAADAQHIAAEMLGKLWKDRDPLRSVAMSTDTSLLTAIGNDWDYDSIFSRQVEGMVRRQDVFIGITTSGNSKNIIRALEACKQVGGTSILLSGKDGGQAKSKGLADHYIIAPGDTTAHIQEAHIAIYHALCFGVENSLIERGFIKFR